MTSLMIFLFAVGQKGCAATRELTPTPEGRAYAQRLATVGSVRLVKGEEKRVRSTMPVSRHDAAEQIIRREPIANCYDIGGELGR